MQHSCMFPRVQHSCIICLFEWTYEFLNTAQGKRLLAKEKDCLEPVAPVGKDLEGSITNAAQLHYLFV